MTDMTKILEELEGIKRRLDRLEGYRPDVPSPAFPTQPSELAEKVRIVGYRGAIAVPMTLILSNGQELEFDPDQFCDAGG